MCGGQSAEAEVSRSSAREVATALRRSFRDVTVFELDHALASHLLSLQPDVVFPVVHGPPGEDGTLQGLLEMLRIPYVGSGVAASACAMNKFFAKQVFRGCGLPVLPDVLVRREDRDLQTTIAQLQHHFPDGAVVKPVDQGSAIGVTICTDAGKFAAAIEECFQLGSSALIERLVHGKEITVGVLDLEQPIALPVIEIRTPGGWYDFNSRYTPGASEHVIPAPISSSAYALVQRSAMSAHTALGCRDLSRSDFIVTDNGDVWLLEVNTLPGMTATSLYPDGARAQGIDFSDLTERLIMHAVSRHRGK